MSKILSPYVNSDITIKENGITLVLKNIGGHQACGQNVDGPQNNKPALQIQGVQQSRSVLVILNWQNDDHSDPIELITDDGESFLSVANQTNASFGGSELIPIHKIRFIPNFTPIKKFFEGYFGKKIPNENVERNKYKQRFGFTVIVNDLRFVFPNLFTLGQSKESSHLKLKQQKRSRKAYEEEYSDDEVDERELKIQKLSKDKKDQKKTIETMKEQYKQLEEKYKKLEEEHQKCLQKVMEEQKNIPMPNLGEFKAADAYFNVDNSPLLLNEVYLELNLEPENFFDEM